jgi:hypothetical protein
MTDSEAAAWTRGHAVGERELKAAERRWQVERAELKAEVEKLRADHATLLDNASIEVRRLRAESNKMEAEAERLRADAERWKCVRRHSWKELHQVRVLAGIRQESVLGQNWEDAIDDLLEAAGTTEQAIAARVALKEPK